MIEKKRTFEVYKITCLINNKVYIGSTTAGLNNRWSSHKFNALRFKKNKLLGDAIRTYKDNFNIKLLESCNCKEHMYNCEEYYIKLYRSNLAEFGYNIALNGKNWYGLKRKKEDIMSMTLNQPNIKPIIQLDIDGNIINEFIGLRNASLITGIAKSTIGHYLKGRVKNIKKYNFKYKDI